MRVQKDISFYRMRIFISLKWIHPAAKQAKMQIVIITYMKRIGNEMQTEKWRSYRKLSLEVAPRLLGQHCPPVTVSFDLWPWLLKSVKVNQYRDRREQPISAMGGGTTTMFGMGGRPSQKLTLLLRFPDFPCIMEWTGGGSKCRLLVCKLAKTGGFSLLKF